MVYIILLVGASLFPLSAVGQVSHQEDGQSSRDSLFRLTSEPESERFACRFTYALNSSAISESLGNNVKELSWLDDFIHYAQSRPNRYIEHITLIGYSSIDGSYHFNEMLARQRAEDFLIYLKTHYPAFSRYPHHVAWVGEDWKGFTAAVKESDITSREEVLEIVHKVQSYEQREQLIRRLNGGIPYNEMTEQLLPSLRRVEIEMKYTNQPVDTTRIEKITTYQSHTNNSTAIPRLSIPEKDIEQNKTVADILGIDFNHQSKRRQNPPAEHATKLHRPQRFAIKTNLLLWVGVMPDFEHTTPVSNLALEYYFNNHWSVEVGGAYSNRHYNSGRKLQGVSGYRLEPRYRHIFPCEWLEVYVGGYGRLGEYNIETSQNPISKTGHYWDAGISTGLYLRLIGGLGIEAGLRGGYVRTTTTQYTQEDNDNWLDSYAPYNKIKVTDLNVSLTYRF